MSAKKRCASFRQCPWQIESASRMSSSTLILYLKAQFSSYRSSLCIIRVRSGVMMRQSLSMLSVLKKARSLVLRHSRDWFRPSRWDEELASKIGPYEYMPFLAGGRQCIGNRFALTEMKILLAILITKFQFFEKPGFEVVKKQFVTLRPSPNMTLRVKSLFWWLSFFFVIIAVVELSPCVQFYFSECWMWRRLDMALS